MSTSTVPSTAAGVDARDLAPDHAVPGVDFRSLPHRHVVDERLGNLEFGLEARRVRHAGQFVPGSDQLADLHAHELENAVQTCPDPEPVDFLPAQCDQGLHLLDARRLRRQLCIHGGLAGILPGALQPEPLLQLLHGDARLHQRHAIREAGPGQLEVRVVLRLGLEVLGLNVRGQGLLGQALVLQLCLEIRQVGLGGPQLGLRVEVLLLDLRAAQVQQHRVRLYRLAGLDAPSLDPARVARRDHDNGLRHQRADAPHLSQHLAAFHRVCEYDGGIHAGRRRLDS